MTESFTTKPPGPVHQFETGAAREQKAGKGRYDLVPRDMLRRWAELYERGAINYGERNWEKGLPLKSFIDSAFRHLTQLADGDRSEDHAAAVLFNTAGLEWTLAEVRAGRLPPGLADGTAFEERVRVQQFSGENAHQHRQRVNRPWTPEELASMERVNNAVLEGCRAKDRVGVTTNPDYARSASELARLDADAAPAPPSSTTAPRFPRRAD